MPSLLTILCSDEPNKEDLNLLKVAELLGLHSKIISLQNYIDEIHSIDKSGGPVHYIAVRCDTLYIAFQNTKVRRIIDKLLLDEDRFWFIYDCKPDETPNIVLPNITDNAIISVSRFNDNNYKYTVSKNIKNVTGELTDICFGPINNSCDFKFVLTDQNTKENIDEIISIGDYCFFISLRKFQNRVFLLASGKIIDVDSYLNKGVSLRNYFSQFAPLMMFLKYVFKKACWHNDNLYANFIIDDPLLKKNYGFLDYEKLINSMHEHDFTTTIAFIPWNYKRTDKRFAEVLLKEKDNLNICVHGCDHTKGEFACSEEDELYAMIHLATQRMDAHSSMTGIDYTKGIVFPQGIFSLKAMKMLKKNNYIAAINSSAYPVELNKIKMSDALDAVIMCHENFPLFTRRYPSADIVDFAIDAFLGKPLLIVEHHGYFKDGYGECEKFVQTINSLLDRTQWKGLNEILESTYLMRIDDSGQVFCKIYSNRVCIKNSWDTKRRFNIQKKETLNLPINSVFVNKNVVDYNLHDSLLEISFELLPQEAVTVEIDYQNTYNPVKYRKPLSKNIKNTCRRYLSEVRDNYLSKNEFLLDFSVRIKKIFSH